MQQTLFDPVRTDVDVNTARILSIEGLNIFYNVVSKDEEKNLLDHIDNQDWILDLKRRVQHYGYKYDYKTRKISNDFYIGALPDWLTSLANGFLTKSLIDFLPDQAIINEYFPGQGIAPHVDCEPCFDNTIISLSLGSACTMIFESLISADRGKKVEVMLPERSLVVLKGSSRYNWTHAIAGRKKDTFNESTIVRSRRVSITFRKVIIQTEFYGI